jgi:Ca-activated chloride channel family protein
MTSRAIAGLAIAAGLAAPLSFSGQAPIQPPVNLALDSTLVLVPVAVSDQRNRPASGLKKENFQVFDDGVEQKPTVFAREDEPAAICVVVDISSSMSGAGGLGHAALLAAWFFRTANREDQLCAVTVATEAKLFLPLADHPGPIMERQLLSLKTGGTTALLDGIRIAMSEVKKAHTPRKALVIVSDGGDNNSRYTLTEIRGAVLESDALIYAFGSWGSAEGSHWGRKREVLKVMTQESGGLVLGGSPREFAEGILTDLHNRYLLGFSPTDPAKDGRLHRLEVKLVLPQGLPKLRARWKTGYYAARNENR